MDLREMGQFSPEGHWYYEAKSSVILNDLKRNLKGPPKILDMGAGSGYFSRKIVDELGGRANCVDINYNDEILGEDINFSRVPTSTDYNVILLLDVLEHVQHPRKLLQEVLSRAASGCLVFITVPAFMLLWSGHDDFLGHFKRYKLSEIDSLLNSVNFEFRFLRKRYLYSLLFPIVLLQRKMAREEKSLLKPLHPFLNQLLLAICRVDHWFKSNKHFGVSVYFLVRVLDGESKQSK